MEEKILSVYTKGMTTSGIGSHMKDLYGLKTSDSTISRITDRILPIVKEWQEYPLKEVYDVVYMEYTSAGEGRIIERRTTGYAGGFLFKRAVYIAIGLDMDGRKDVLGMYMKTKRRDTGLSIINGLKNRRVRDILIDSVDGLNGFPHAIAAVYPQTEIQ